MTRRTTLVAVALGFVAVLLLVVTDWAPLRRLDLDVAHGLNDATAPHPALVSFWKTVSELGQPFTFQVIAVIAAVLLWRRRRVPTALFVAFTVVLAGLLSNIVKWSVGRARPTVPDTIAHAGGTSFPSGHALSSCVGVTVLLLVFAPELRRRVRAAAIAVGVLLVLLIGFSRLALGVHYVSDVTAGWLLGLTWALAAWTATTALTSRAMPAPSPASPGPPPGTPAG